MIKWFITSKKRIMAAILCVALTVPLIVQAVTITPEMYDAQFTGKGWETETEDAARSGLKGTGRDGR